MFQVGLTHFMLTSFCQKKNPCDTEYCNILDSTRQYILSKWIQILLSNMLILASLSKFYVGI